MKGMLFLLALLVTGELGFQTTEAYLPPFEVHAGVSSGNKAILNAVLTKYGSTDRERKAFGKLLECFTDAGVEGKILDAKLLEAIIFSPECREYYKQIEVIAFQT
ncbi:androgen-binding protein homolog isoform X2 [Alexandromys fortis]|uniref:androgen-binding protein homolog isoform X2 n=1 Tax=Alexandromys fortis TaxID=100897 RepID=UPI00215209A6|nr:androgen-binding protein homolog isoform X2 [Microtus fortis]